MKTKFFLCFNYIKYFTEFITKNTFFLCSNAEYSEKNIRKNSFFLYFNYKIFY